MIQFIRDSQIYNDVICTRVPAAKNFLWIATADIKDLHVAKGARMVPFLETLSDLVDRNVEVRLLHAKEPGPRFREDHDKYPNLLRGMERILCPRVHFKTVVVDGEFAYSGSANLTGAGMGAKSSTRRNFEGGIITDDAGMLAEIMEQFDEVWRGDNCGKCQRKKFCADYRQLLGRE